MPFLEANGVTIGYDVHGARPPLVLLHGATSAGREDWAAEVPLLSKAFRVYLPDARGHATTRWDPADGWSFAALVDDLAGFVDALGLGTFHLAGISMGNHLLALLAGPAVLMFLAATVHGTPAASAVERRQEWATVAVVAGLWALLIGTGLGSTPLIILGGLCFVAGASFASVAGVLPFALLSFAVAGRA